MNTGGCVMGSGETRQMLFSTVIPSADGAHAVTAGDRRSSQGFLNTIKDEKSEQTQSLQNPKYEAPLQFISFNAYNRLEQQGDLYQSISLMWKQRVAEVNMHDVQETSDLSVKHHSHLGTSPGLGFQSPPPLSASSRFSHHPHSFP